MPKACEVAAELRKLADALDKEPETEIHSMTVSAWHWGQNDKKVFQSLVSLLPRPLAKTYDESELGDVKVTHKTAPLTVVASIQRAVMCELIEPARPAKYRCAPLLSEQEEAALAEQ